MNKTILKKFGFACLFLFTAASYTASAQGNAADIKSRLQFVNVESLSLAVGEMSQTKGFDASKYSSDLQFIKTNLANVKEAMLQSDDPDLLKKAETILEKQRRILLANPLLDMDKIVVTNFVLDGRARVGMANEMCMPMTNYMGLIEVPPTGYEAQICELNELRSATPKRRTIYRPTKGEGIADVQLHWNGDKMLFASPVPVSIDAFYGQRYPSWRILEVGIDGKDLKLISDAPEPDLEYADPCYLPDGRILFTNNIGYNGIPCEHGERVIMNLAIYNPKDKSMRKITTDQDCNWSPTVLHNGRIMYTRYEYTDLTHYFSRIVMHGNPDGTETRALYGSNSYFPTSLMDMQQLPNSGNQFIGVVSGHHGVPRSGRLMIFDPAKSRSEAEGVVQEIPFRNRSVEPIIRDRLVDGVWPQFLKPFPLNEKYFLTGAKLHRGGLWGIYLVDIYDNVTLIAEFEGEGLLAPIPVTKRPIPPVIPDKVIPGEKEATVFIQDIYTGEGLQGVPRGVVKKLRVFSYEYAYMKSPSDFDALGVQSGWDLKRELGTVDVEEDGSAIFKVPANAPISLQPLDAEGNAIQWMRSWFTAMPGEVVSCVGCHEDQNSIVIPKRVTASQKKPAALQAPEGGVRPFSYEREIQPILDKYCISCHDGNGEAMDLSGKHKTEYKRWGNYTTHRYLYDSYYNLHPYVYRQGPEAEIKVLQPYEYHKSNSELIQLLDKGHYNVKLSDKDYNKLCQWIDFNVPYFGDFEITCRYKATFDQYPRRIQLMNKYANYSVDWQKELRDYSNYLKEQGEVVPVKPEPIKNAVSTKKGTDKWAFDADQAKAMQQESAPAAQKSIEVAPGVTMKFVWVPKGDYTRVIDNGSGVARTYKNESIKKGFWMGEIEVSNAQYCALVPTHDSRFIGQQWKDHTTPGYPANTPAQSAIRVTHPDALAYCKMLSEKANLKVTLPTAEQWEWACRAGSATDMWYGDVTTDYSEFENMADFTIKDLAVYGLEPTVPMPDNFGQRKYWDYVPRDKFAKDGSLISVAGGKYKPNPWGLHDMHGNVAEWARELNKENGDKAVACGGSWRDRAAKSTAFTRRYYHPWQAPFNVGFRVIIEE